MKLFDNIQKGGSDFASYTEPAFVFLNRTSREEVARIREILEVWFEHYPLTEQAEIRSRFQSSNDIQHKSAFFELFLHELFLRLGCKLSLHPSLENTSKTPDFLIEPEINHKFYLEATVVTCEGANDKVTQALENTVYEVLDRLVDSPDYFLDLTVSGSLKSSPPSKRIANDINTKLRHLDYDEILRTYKAGDFQSLPRWVYEHDGWNIEVQLIPKNKLRGKKGVRPIGSKSTDFRMVDHWTPIRHSILKKGTKYGKLVVCQNSILG